MGDGAVPPARWGETGVPSKFESNGGGDGGNPGAICGPLGRCLAGGVPRSPASNGGGTPPVWGGSTTLGVGLPDPEVAPASTAVSHPSGNALGPAPESGGPLKEVAGGRLGGNSMGGPLGPLEPPGAIGGGLGG